jgi:hypothetical protein
VYFIFVVSFLLLLLSFALSLSLPAINKYTYLMKGKPSDVPISKSNLIRN